MPYSLFKSRAFWTILAMFLVGGLNAVVHVLPADMQIFAMALLGALATYFHVNPSQQYNEIAE